MSLRGRCGVLFAWWGIGMLDGQKYPQGAIWNWLLDGILTIALVVPVVALVLFLI
jgi:hypothetical protein